MQDSPSLHQAQVNELIAHLRRYIQDAVEICERGEYIELTMLEPQVQAIQSAIAQMPVAQGVEYVHQLEQAMGDLERLQHLMISLRERLGQELNDVSRHQQAARAYKIAEVTVPVSATDES